MGVLFPWPSRQRRQEAIGQARDQKERSRSSAAHAALIERDIERMADRNHFAALIAEQLVQQQRHPRGET